MFANLPLTFARGGRSKVHWQQVGADSKLTKHKKKFAGLYIEGTHKIHEQALRGICHSNIEDSISQSISYFYTIEY